MRQGQWYKIDFVTTRSHKGHRGRDNSDRLGRLDLHCLSGIVRAFTFYQRPFANSAFYQQCYWRDDTYSVSFWLDNGRRLVAHVCAYSGSLRQATTMTEVSTPLYEGLLVCVSAEGRVDVSLRHPCVMV
jgi:hypothetical protein